MAYLTYEQALAKLYTKAEAKLIETIKHKVAHGNATAYERSLLKQVNEQIQALRKSSDILVQQLVKNSYKQGLDALIHDITSDPFAPQSYNLMSGLNTNQINIIVDNITSQLNQAIATVGRRCNDYIRQTALSVTAKKLTTGQTVRQMQRELEANLEKANITSIEYSNGAQHKIKDYASMVARTTTAETQNTAQRIQGKAWGYDLVIMTTHYPTCEVCAMYQGRVYATTKEASNGKYKDKNGNPLLFPYIYDTAFVDGYDTVHPNCRHRFAVFPPNAYTLDELAEFSRQSMQPFVDNRSDEERKAYATEQAIKRKRNESRRQYEDVKRYLPDQVPKTFSGWQRMKSANSQRYRDLIDDYKTVKKLVANSEKSGIIKTNTTSVNIQLFAQIPKEKFTQYALDPQKDPNKAYAFKHALGYTKENYQELIDNIQNNLNESALKHKGTNSYGELYEYVMELTGANGKKANVCTGWIKRNNEDEIRLTSAYVTEKGVTKND